MGKQQFGAARAIISKEWNRISEPLAYQKLNEEAKALWKVIAKEKETKEFNRFSEKDKRVLNLLNEAVRDVKLPYAKKYLLNIKN